MNTLLARFQDGGLGMFPTLVCGILLLAVAMKYAATPEKRAVPLLLALSSLTFTSGLLGFVTGFIVTTHAFSGGADPKVIWVGMGEAANCMALALLLMMFAGVATSVGAWRGSRRPSEA
jgi:hypothetical protein